MLWVWVQMLRLSGFEFGEGTAEMLFGLADVNGDGYVAINPNIGLDLAVVD